MSTHFGSRASHLVSISLVVCTALFACAGDSKPRQVDGPEGGRGGTASEGGSAGQAGSGGGAGTSGSSRAQPKKCATTDDCEGARVCALLEGSASFACYPSCSDEDACSDGSDCVLDAYNHKVCADKCDSSAQEGCLEGETCRDDATARGSGYCVFSGAEGDGAPCGGLDRVCAPGLQCVYPAYAYFGTPRCAPTCSVSASDGAAGACKHGTCEPIWGDLGGCILPCDPFGSNSCSGKQTCEASLKVVMLDETLGQAEPSGQCGLPGEKKSGESCSGGDCVAGLVCGPILNDYAQSRYACGAPCSDEHPCSEGSCASLGLAAKGQQDYGTCQSSCSEVGADCPKGGWCAPSLTTKGLGLCVTEGATDKRKPCATSIECAKGLMCAPESLVCLPVCDPDGNDCSESEICVRADGHAYGVCTAAP